MFRSSDGHQHGFHEKVGRGRSQHREQQQQYQSVPQDFTGTHAVALPQGNGRQRCASGSDNGRKGRNQDYHGTGHANAGQRIRPDTGNMADINAVHDAIQQVHDLGSHSREGHTEHQRQHAVRTQPLFIQVIHASSLL